MARAERTQRSAAHTWPMYRPQLVATVAQTLLLKLRQNTSSLYASVAGNFKVALVVILSTVLLSEHLLPWNIAGVAVTVLAFVVHTCIMKRRPPEDKSSYKRHSVKLDQLAGTTMLAMAALGLLFITLCGYFLWLGSQTKPARIKHKTL